MATGRTLKEVLLELGYSLRPRERPTWQGKELWRGGRKVWAGSAGDCWAWLRETGQIP